MSVTPDYIYYDEKGEDYGTEECECDSDAKWTFRTHGCGCCSANGALTAADAAPELVRLAQKAVDEGRRYLELAKIANKEMQDAESAK